MIKQGNFVIRLQYNKADNFHEGLAAVQKDWRWGYIDRLGNVVIPYQYDEAFCFDGGVAPVKKDGKWMVIDTKGAVKFKTDFKNIFPFHEGVAEVEIRDKKYKGEVCSNLIDKEGNLLFQKDYDLEGNFSEGCIFAYDRGFGKGIFPGQKQRKKSFRRALLRRLTFPADSPQYGLKTRDTPMIDHAGTTIRKLSEEEYNDFSICHEGLVVINDGKWDGSLGGDDKSAVRV